jgi:hypothetical protein
MQFRERCYLVRNHRCTGDACVLREYTTLLDENLVSILIVMQDASQVSASDELFASFELLAFLSVTGEAGLVVGPPPERLLRVDQAGQVMFVIHSVPYIRQGGDKVYDQLDALGIRPSSHGCVRISLEDAQWLKA